MFHSDQTRPAETPTAEAMKAEIGEAAREIGFDSVGFATPAGSREDHYWQYQFHSHL